MSNHTIDHAAVSLVAQAAALCSMAEGRIEDGYPDGTSCTMRAQWLLQAQWHDSRQAWSDPDPDAWTLARTTLRKLGGTFPDDPRTLLRAAAALLNGRARALELGR